MIQSGKSHFKVMNTSIYNPPCTPSVSASPSLPRLTQTTGHACFTPSIFPSLHRLTQTTGQVCITPFLPHLTLTSGHVRIPQTSPKRTAHLKNMPTQQNTTRYQHSIDSTFYQMKWMNTKMIVKTQIWRHCRWILEILYIPLGRQVNILALEQGLEIYRKGLRTLHNQEKGKYGFNWHISQKAIITSCNREI